MKVFVVLALFILSCKADKDEYDDCKCTEAAPNGNYCQKWTCDEHVKDCFPSFASVLIKKEDKMVPVKVKDLKVGDCVHDQVSKDSCSNVTIISHREKDAKTFFARIITENHVAWATFNHLIPYSPIYDVDFDHKNVKFKHIANLNLGDLVWTMSGLELVKEIQFNVSVGIYAPHTKSGTIVVDNVLFSTYSSVGNQEWTHWFFS